MKTKNARFSAIMLTSLLSLAATAFGDTFVSSAFSLDMRMANGRRVAHGTETILACAGWADGDVAVVAQTQPGGSPDAVHTTSGPGIESVSWDAKHAEPGDHLFTHTVSRGGAAVATYSVIFQVPPPSLEAIRIFGPANFHSGNSAQYVCMGYFSDDSGREMVAEWSLPGASSGLAVDGDGLVAADQLQNAVTATLRAVVSDGNAPMTNDFEIAIGPASLSLGEKRLILERTADERSVAVYATGGWVAQSSAPWLVVSEGAGVGDGVLVVSCGRNPDQVRRMATVTVTCGSLEKVVQVMQYPQEADDLVTVVFDPQGGTVGYAEREYVVGTPYGALPFPSLPGKVFGGWWTSAGGQGTHVMAGSEVTATIRRLYAYWRDRTTGDALNGALGWMSDADEPWVIDESVSRGDGCSMRSGQLGDTGTSTIMTEVTGPGRLSFWWRTSSDLFDWVAFSDGNRPVSDISGETGWQHVEYGIQDSSPHVLRWSYEKWSGVGSGQDCAWLDEVVWMPDFTSGETAGQDVDDHVVPAAWRTLHGLGDTSADLDSDGDGLTDWEEYVAGSNPVDPTSIFRISISMENGTPVLSNIPDLGSARQYTLEGKARLSDASWQTPTNSTHRFFRAKVNLK